MTRHAAQATSLSWIPSEAVAGMSRLPFERGVVHYDPSPPDHLDGADHLAALLAANRFRFANVLSAWIDVASDGRIIDSGQDGETQSGELESRTERELSSHVMAADGRRIEKVARGVDLLRQGDEGDELYLLLDGIVSVAVDGVVLAELGPGAVLGERAGLGGGRRTATVTARTICRVAVTDAAALPIEAVTALAEEHRREDRPQGGSPPEGRAPAG